MKHAGKDTIDQLAPFLVQLRQYQLLKEKKAGIFYVKSKAFLHFHEDPKGIFADIKLDQIDFDRFRVSTADEQQRVLKKIDQYVSAHA